jgi:hypothetical protein
VSICTASLRTTTIEGFVGFAATDGMRIPRIECIAALKRGTGLLETKRHVKRCCARDGVRSSWVKCRSSVVVVYSRGVVWIACARSSPPLHELTSHFMASGSDVHDPQARGALLRGLLVQLPADGRVDAAAVDALAACVRRHHLLQPLRLAEAGSAATAPLHEWLERLLHLLSSPKVIARALHLLNPNHRRRRQRRRRPLCWVCVSKTDPNHAASWSVAPLVVVQRRSARALRSTHATGGNVARRLPLQQRTALRVARTAPSHLHRIRPRRRR